MNSYFTIGFIWLQNQANGASSYEAKRWNVPQKKAKVNIATSLLCLFSTSGKQNKQTKIDNKKNSIPITKTGLN